MKNFIHKLPRYQIFFILFFLTSVSYFAMFRYFQNGENLLYADAISRLDIARKVVDNITPGLTQLGNVWLPLPQILMLPFIWNTYLWHSGIAGALMSGTAFIIGGIYVYKASKLISHSFLGALIALCVYALNINILYLQTTAMSESLFVCTLAVSIYYFLQFFTTNNKYYLIPAALAVCAMTSTRYEGLSVLVSSIPIIYTYTFLKTRKFAQAESNTIMYALLACFGFACWTIYLWAIFGDPLYWQHYYTSASVVKGTGATYYTQAKPFIAAVWEYFTASVWMIGLIPVLLSLVAIPIMLVKDIKNRTVFFLPLLMPLAIFFFMVLTLQRNTPIVQPALTLSNIFSSEVSQQTGFNIRYGMLLLPWVAIMVAYLFSFKYKIINIFMMLLFISLFSIQIYSYFSPKYSVIYQIPARILEKPLGMLVSYMKQNYDGGYIFISATGHEDQMFQMGFDYKTYIHEGTNKYWKESLDDPPHYATWVIVDKGQNADLIAKKQGIYTVLNRDFNLMFQEDQASVYKIKTKPYFQIKQ